jgi:sensor histidine kinase YesM
MINSISDTQIFLIIVCVGALGMSIKIMANFSAEAARLRPKLGKINHALTVLRDRAQARKPNIEVLQEVTAPLREKEKTLRTYLEQLRQIDLAQMRKEDEEQQEREGKRIRHRG